MHFLLCAISKVSTSISAEIGNDEQNSDTTILEQRPRKARPATAVVLGTESLRFPELLIQINRTSRAGSLSVVHLLTFFFSENFQSVSAPFERSSSEALPIQQGRRSNAVVHS